MERVMESMIVFRVGDEHIGIDILHVREVVEWQDPVKVPKVPEFILGLVNIRGTILPVVSLRKRLGLGGVESGELLLIAEAKGRVAGLKVDELFGTKKVDTSRLSDRRELRSTKKETDFFMGIYEDDKKPIHILDLEKTLSKEVT
jgi:purine-binding chemotaxis protein CheW